MQPSYAAALSLLMIPVLLALWGVGAFRNSRTRSRWQSAKVRLAVASDLGLPPSKIIDLSNTVLLRLRETAGKDVEIGIMNRPSGLAAAEQALKDGKKKKTDICCAYLEIPRDKNDLDEAKSADYLRNLVNLMGNNLRMQDILFRYGMNQLVILMPGVKIEAALSIFSDLARIGATANLPFYFGVSTYIPGEDDILSLLARADKSMKANPLTSTVGEGSRWLG